MQPIFVKNFLPEVLCNFVHSYCILKYSNIDEISPDGTNNTDSFVNEYGDYAMETLLDMSTSVVEENVGKKLFPVNAFVRIYDKGSVLKVHKDRKECQYTVALCLGSSPSDIPYDIFSGNIDPNSDYKFFADNRTSQDELVPLAIENKFSMIPNSALIFQGVDKFHWREFCKHDYFITCFLHYVDQDGEHAKYKFDGRNRLGEQRVHDPNAK